MNIFYRKYFKMAYYHSKYSHKSRHKKMSLAGKILTFILLVLIFLSLLAGYLLYKTVFEANVWLNGKPEVSVIIPRNTEYNEILQILYKDGIIIHRENFEWLARRKNLAQYAKPGHYLILDGMNNNTLINMFLSGNQSPVKVTFNNIRTFEELAGKLSRQIESDSLQLLRCFKDTFNCRYYGFTPEAYKCMFIPNTYEVYFTITPEELTERMFAEFNAFYDSTRREKLKTTGLTLTEAVTLASIVEKETVKREEKAKIAGVYLNRIKRNWLLQADPTVVYALGNFSLKRVLNEHKKFESPYNTYLYAGLPPGPICFPETESIEAVLNFEKHDYLFFCARADFSGYHDFSRSYSQHIQNAKRYQQAVYRYDD